MHTSLLIALVCVDLLTFNFIFIRGGSSSEGGIVESSENEKVWLPRVYEGGDPYLNNSLKERDPDLKAYLDAHDDPSPWRVQIVAVVTNSSSNGTALEYVHKVFDFIKAGTNNDDRIVYQILSFSQIDDQVSVLS
jgi:hypothetical protein